MPLKNEYVENVKQVTLGFLIALVAVPLFALLYLYATGGF